MVNQQVDDQNSIRLNRKNYRIVSRVQRELASKFPEKFVLGDFQEESHPLVSTITWDNFIDGMLKEIAALPRDINRSNFTTLNTRHEKHLFTQYGSLPAVLGKTSSNDRINKYVEFAGALLGITDSQHVLNMSAVLSDTFMRLPAVGIDVTVGRVQGGLLLAATSSLGVTWDFNNLAGSSGSEDTDTTEKITHLAVWREMLWGVNNSAELFFTGTVNDTTNKLGWTKVADADVQNSKQKGLLTGPDEKLYLVANNGLHQYQNETETFKHVFKVPSALHSGNAFTVWDESIYYANDLEIWKWTPAELSGFGRPTAEAIGLDADDGLPNGRLGSINALTHSHRNLFAQVEGQDTTKFSTVYAWDRRGWETFATSSATTQTLGDGLYAGGINRLPNSHPLDYQFVPGWLSSESSGFTHSYSLRANQLSPTQTDTGHVLGFNRANTSRDFLVTPWVTPDGKQTWNALGISAVHSFLSPFGDAVTDSTFINISYGKDFESSFTLAASIKGATDSVGTTDITLPLGQEGNIGVPFSAFRLRIGMNNSGTLNSRTSGDINRLSLHISKNLDPLWGFSFEVDINKQGYGRTAKETREDLKALFDSKTLVHFSFKGDAGAEESYVVRPLSFQSVEETGTDNSGRYLVRVAEVN